MKFDVRLILTAVVILAVFVGVQRSSQKSVEKAIKAQINQVVQAECLANASAVTFQKYNDFVQGAVEQQLTARRLNLEKGDKAKATADLVYANRYKGDLIPVLTPKQLQKSCSKPLLK